MKRILSAVMCAVIVMSSLAYLCSCGNTPEEAAPGDFYETDNITVDKVKGRATYNDGIVSFSWTVDQWLFGMRDGTPDLTIVKDGVDVGFTVLADNAGVAEDLYSYAKSALGGYYGAGDEYLTAHMFFQSKDRFYTGKGYFGVQTGYYDMDYFSEEPGARCDLAIVHAVTDGRNSALVCVYAEGRQEDIKALHSAMFKDNEYHPILEEVARDVADSFEFVFREDENGVEAYNKEYFSYKDAYEMFKGDYTRYGGHAGYIEFIDNEANKMKNEVVKLNNEIVNRMKDKYQEISGYEPKCTYSDYYEKFVRPYEEYFLYRMDAAKKVQMAYLGIAEVLTYGGNAGSDCAVLWKYAHYRNLYNELRDLKDFIK